MSTTAPTAPTDLLAFLAAPTAPAAPTTAPTTRKATPAARKDAAFPTPAAIGRLHEHFTAAREMRVVFGMTADRTAAITAVLAPSHRIAKDGTLVAPELATVSPVTGDGRMRSNGRAVALGVTIQAPTAGKESATRATRAIVVGYGIEAPVPVKLTGDHPRYVSADAATIVLTDGRVMSLRIYVRIARSGDAWDVTGRVYTGGRLADTDAETLALAALDTGEAGEAAIVQAAAIVTGAAPRNATRAAGNRAKVRIAKRAARK